MGEIGSSCSKFAMGEWVRVKNGSESFLHPSLLIGKSIARVYGIRYCSGMWVYRLEKDKHGFYFSEPELEKLPDPMKITFNLKRRWRKSTIPKF